MSAESPPGIPRKSHTGCVLIADDSEDDRFLLARAFKQAGLGTRLFFATTGHEACDYLEGHEQHANRENFPLPDLLLLDLRMPRMDGLEVLAWLRTHPELSHIPVVIITGSANPVDRELANKLSVADFRIKPDGTPALLALVKEMHERWLTKNPPLPTRDGTTQT